ncbi:MAG: hypothetical protein ACXWLH_05050 [Candidatus Saccharimonadales bacterium]
MPQNQSFQIIDKIPEFYKNDFKLTAAQAVDLFSVQQIKEKFNGHTYS